MTRVCTGNCRGPEGDRPDVHVRYLAVFALLLWPAVSAADLLNSGFEQPSYSVTPSPDNVPQGWRLEITNTTRPFGSQVISVWKTEGVRSAGLYSRCNRTFTAGTYQSIYQGVNLTGMAAIVFDVRLAAYGVGTDLVFDGFEAVLLVDDIPLWTQSIGGTYLGQQVDISNVTGPDPHRLELCIRTKTPGAYVVANWVQWDNVRLVKTPDEVIIDAVVDADPDTLNLNSNGNWVTCYIELPTGHDVNDIDGQTVTLEGVSAHMGQEDWACAQANASNIMDHDGDGIVERMVKFDRSAVQALLKPGVVTITVKGKLPNHITLRGTDLIKVIGKSEKLK